MKEKTEYEKFDDLARGVLSVSRGQVKRKLNAEKRAKKRKKAKKSSASREGA